MRAAIIYDCLFPLSLGGGERVYRRMAEVLVAEGYDVDYLTRDVWSPGSPPRAEFRIVPVWSGEIADADGNRRTSAALAFAAGVARALRRSHDYDLVIASSLPVLTLLGAAWGMRGTRIPLVADWLEVWGLRKWISYAGPVSGPVAFALQRVGAHVTRLHTVNSRFTADRLRRIRRGIHPIELGLLDLAAEASAPAAPATPPYALAVGRLIPDKRVAVLPEALALARRHVPALRLKIVGSGPEEDAVRRAVEATDAAEAVDLLGRVSDDELSVLRAGAAVFVHPSSREGFGLVVAEAAAAGTPSVVIPGPDNAAAELVIDGVNGFSASSARAEDLSAAITRVIRGGAALRASTADWFDQERRQRSIPRAIRRVLDQIARG